MRLLLQPDAIPDAASGGQKGMAEFFAVKEGLLVGGFDDFRKRIVRMLVGVSRQRKQRLDFAGRIEPESHG
ncbi:MAG: hypothetical protein WBC04_07805 [Candidatus Acidiferrales bacterium]